MRRSIHRRVAAGIVAGALTLSGTVAGGFAASAATCTVTGDIGRAWNAVGGAFSRLGPCTTGELRVSGGGVAQHFTGGSVYWNPATGAHPVVGAVRGEYAAHGWENSFLGFPTTSEFVVRGGRGQHFQGGSIYWSAATGAHEVRGQIREAWAARGWELSALGFPTSGEIALALEGGRLQSFQGGTVYWTAGIGPRTVNGAVRAVWAARGYENGDLGYPVSDEYDVPGGRRSDFQFGTVGWDRATGRTEVTLTSTVGPWVRPSSVTPAVPACRPVDAGYNGIRVKLVQRQLGIAGSEVEWNSGTTTTAIRSFQRSAGLPVTGTVDRTTWERLGVPADFCLDGWQQPIQVVPGATAAQRVETMIAVAQRYLGDEYVWGGTGPEGYGVDCSGLVLQAALAAGLSPRPVTVALHPLADYRTSAELYAHPGLRHVPVGETRRGDLVFYTSGNPGRIVHVAIALGDGRMIEAPNQRNPVRIAATTTRRGSETIAPTVVRLFN